MREPLGTEYTRLRLLTCFCSVLHIELRKWADVLLIAPLSANTLAKIAGGLCDNLLTSVVRAWDFSKPFLGGGSFSTDLLVRLRLKR